MDNNNTFYPAENWQESQCAFCNQPIDYCQGHGADRYAVRAMSDGMLTQPIEFYEFEENAYARMEAIVLAADHNTHIDVYDQAGDVLAAEFVE